MVFFNCCCSFCFFVFVILGFLCSFCWIIVLWRVSLVIFCCCWFILFVINGVRFFWLIFLYVFWMILVGGVLGKVLFYLCSVFCFFLEGEGKLILFFLILEMIFFVSCKVLVFWLDSMMLLVGFMVKFVMCCLYLVVLSIVFFLFFFVVSLLKWLIW